MSDEINFSTDSVNALELKNNEIDAYKKLLSKLQSRIQELEDQIHRARNLWADSKRDPETGFVHVKYLDEFEEAIKSRHAQQGGK